MPQDCEISWREDQPSIKDRNIFGILLDYSSKLHKANMRLLLIILACLATCLCLPHTKQRRDILPGDPRYGTEHDHHHHHHENTIVDVKSINGHYESTPSVLNEAYGPPGLHPGVPLNDYLPPVIDSVQYSTPLPPYGAHGVVEVPHGLNSIVEPNNIHLHKTVIPTAVPAIVEKTEGIIAPVPTTSYGVPIDTNIKTIVKSAAHAHIKTIDTTNAEISTPAVKVIEHAPVVPGLTSFVNGIHTGPAVSTIGTKNFIGNTLLNGGWPNVQTAYGGSYIPGYGAYSHIPTSFYSGLPSPFDITSTGFAGIGLNHGIYAPESLSLSAHSFPQTLQVPCSLNHHAHHTEPVHTLESLRPVPSLNIFPSVERVQSVESLTPVHAVHSVKSLPPVHTVHSGGSFTTVEPVHSVETLTPAHPVHHVNCLPPVEPVHPVHTLTPLHALHSVKTLAPVHPVDTLPPSHALHSVTSLPPVEPVHPVSTLAPFHALHSVTSLPPVEPVHPVSTLAPFRALHSVTSLPPVAPVHPVSTLAPFRALHSVTSLPPVEPVHPVSTLAPFHALHSVTSLPPVEPVHPVSTLAPFRALHSATSLAPVAPVHPVSTLTPFNALHSLKSLPPVGPVHSVESLTHLHPVHSVKSLTPLPTLHSIDNLHPVHLAHTVESVRATDFPLRAPVHSVGAVTTSYPFESEHAVTKVVKTNTLPIIDKHVRIGTQKGPFEEFFQNLGSLFPQLPQFPPLPDFGSVAAPVAPAVEISSPSSHLLTESINKESVTVEAPILPSEHLVKNVFTSANGYLQPTDANGGYIY